MSGCLTQVLLYHTIKEVKSILNKHRQNIAKKQFCGDTIVVCSLFVVAPFVCVCVRGVGCLFLFFYIVLCVLSS